MTIQPSAKGIVLTIRVIPRASRSRVEGVREQALVVRLNAPPVDGAANDALVRVLAEALDVPRRSVAILSGERSRQKRVAVAGISAAEAARRLGIEA